VGVLVQLRAALDFGKTSRTKRRTTRFRSRAQVGSRWTMATAAGDGGDGKNPLRCLRERMESGGADEGGRS
jgi:hypothetical protein